MENPEETILQDIIPENDLKEINNLRVALEKLRVQIKNQNYQNHLL